MTFRPNNAHSRNIRFDVTRIATIAAVGFSILITRSSDAGLIETTKEAITKQSAAKDMPVVTLCRSTVDVDEAVPLQSISSIIRYACKHTNVFADQFANILDASTTNGSNDLRTNPKDTDHLLSNLSTIVSRDWSRESQARGFDDREAFAHRDTLTPDERCHSPSFSYAAGHETIFIGGKNTFNTSPTRPFSGREAQERGSSDRDEYESSDEESPEEGSATALHGFVHVESFDPTAASALFLILSGIALAVNVIPRLTTQTDRAFQ